MTRARAPRPQRALMACLAVAALLLVACAATDIPRTAATDAHARVNTGDALLVCAYGSEKKCRDRALEGSISLTAFETRAPTLSKDQELIFYCS